MKERRFKHYELGSGCGVEACLEVIGGKWKGVDSLTWFSSKSCKDVSYLLDDAGKRGHAPK